MVQQYIDRFVGVRRQHDGSIAKSAYQPARIDTKQPREAPGTVIVLKSYADVS